MFNLVIGDDNIYYTKSLLNYILPKHPNLKLIINNQYVDYFISKIQSLEKFSDVIAKLLNEKTADDNEALIKEITFVFLMIVSPLLK